MNRRTAAIIVLAVFLIAPVVTLVASAPGGSSPTTTITIPEDTPSPMELIGMREQDAEVEATSRGWTWRVTARNGEPIPGTADYRYDRLNAEIIDGRVTSLFVG
jgi:hypothetical protein